MNFKYYEDPILGKGRAQVTGGTGGGGTEYIGGDRINIAGGTISFVNSSDIVNFSGSSVTLQPDTAYKILATTGAVNVTANPPPANKWAYEGHAEIFVGSVGYVVFDTSKIVLANQLEPDSVNNCTLRFHDGMCYVSVEDHIAGYIVVSATGTTEGTLPYAVSTAAQEYVAFDASLNGTTIPLSGAVANGEKHIVGNGYTETAITGAVDCGTSKFTVANLSLDDVQVTGGTMIFGDAYIPSGSTVAVSGGGLAIEKVTGAGEGSVIDLGGTDVRISSFVSGVVFESGAATTAYHGGVDFYNGILSGCTITNCYPGATNCGYAAVQAGKTATLINCRVTGNTQNNYSFFVRASSTLSVSNCDIDNAIRVQFGQVQFAGSNGFQSFIAPLFNSSTNAGSVNITSGAILDLTGNTNATPINPGGGVIVDGGCQVITSAGSTVSIAGGTYTKINNDGTTE